MIRTGKRNSKAYRRVQSIVWHGRPTNERKETCTCIEHIRTRVSLYAVKSDNPRDFLSVGFSYGLAMACYAPEGTAGTLYS